MWTEFWDMGSGGRKKLDWDFIYIEASRDDAIQIFKQTFGIDPLNVTCDCCGADYHIVSHELIEALITIDEYINLANVKFIYDENEQGDL